MNSPGRQFWEPFDYFQHEKVDAKFLAPFLSWLKVWDHAASQRVDHFIANSKTPQKRIRKYYRRESEVIHPFVDLPDSLEEIKEVDSSGDYFLVLSRLAPWKKIDIGFPLAEALISTIA